MATSFAAFASQFLNKQQNAASSLSSSHPMFFSFTTDDGSRAGHDFDPELDDLDDPHLRTSSVTHTSRRDPQSTRMQDDDDDPYLRLDEEISAPRTNTRHDSQLESSPRSSESSNSSKGWLAHQTAPLRHSRSPSPSPSSSSSSSPPPDLFSPTHPSPLPPPLSTRQPVSLSLTDSLLPRDGRSRPVDVFSLPDPRHFHGRRKYNDFIWTAIWCTAVSLCYLSSFFVLIFTHKPSRSSHTKLPYTTFLHTVPLLTILTFMSAFVAYVHIFLLQIFVKPVMIATSVFIPATLLVSAIWAFVGSFMWDGNQEPTWGETVGLRLFALVPLVFAFLTARRLLNLPRDIHTASVTLTLTTRLLIANPFLLALSPAILLITLLCSIPFVTLIFRLLLIGYFSHQTDSTLLEWHIRGWANWAIGATVAVWLWSWGVSRGILRVTCAGVIGMWYFTDQSVHPQSPTSTHTIHAALTRATSPSLGTIVLSALIITIIRLLSLLTLFLRRVPFYISLRWILTIAATSVRMLEGVTTALSRHALIYTGLTGDAFFVSARRAKALTDVLAAAKDGRKSRSEPPLTLLTVAPLTLTFPFALATYLFVAHTLGAPDEALGAAVLAGGVTGLVGLFCVGLVQDTVDTLYMCYCIDKEVGDRRKPEVFSAFEPDVIITNAVGGPSRRSPATGQGQGQGQGQRNRQQEHRTVPIEHLLPRQPREQLKPVPEPTEDIDVDPFDQSYLAESVPVQLNPRAQGQRSPPVQRANVVSPEAKPRVTTTNTVIAAPTDADRDLERNSVDPFEEDSQLFPGSDLF